MNLKRALAPVAVVAALGVAACGDDDEETSSSGENGPKVSFASPVEGEMTADWVPAEVELEDFELDAVNVGKAVEEGKGHLHFSLDGGKFDKPKYSGPNGKLAKKLGAAGKYSPSVKPTITYKKLPKGKHTLVVELANNDHASTGVSNEVSFTKK